MHIKSSSYAAFVFLMFEGLGVNGFNGFRTGPCVNIHCKALGNKVCSNKVMKKLSNSSTLRDPHCASQLCKLRRVCVGSGCTGRTGRDALKPKGRPRLAWCLTKMMADWADGGQSLERQDSDPKWLTPCSLWKSHLSCSTDLPNFNDV